MKTFLSILLVVIVLGGLWWWSDNRVPTPSGNGPKENTRVELCFAKFEASPESVFEDKHTLSLSLDGEKAAGELKFLPAEKDALVGTFEGTVTPASDASLSRSVHAWWDAQGEGHTSRQELAIIFDGNSAKIGLGEMMDRGDGTYVYKDPATVDYSLILPGVSCEGFKEREAVEEYLWKNIGTLSPVAPALGGSWYVVSATIDPQMNTGTAVYEDGHIQERRSFSYQYENGRVKSLTLE